MNYYDLTAMTWQEVADSLKTVQFAIIPIGAHEQHGPHMVESCDAVLAEKMAKKLGEKMFPYALITPTINMGVSQHHLNFPGTIALQPATLISIIRDMISSLKQHGIQKYLLIKFTWRESINSQYRFINVDKRAGGRSILCQNNSISEKCYERVGDVSFIWTQL